MSILVLHTYGILQHPGDHPSTQDFLAAAPGVHESAVSTSGLLKWGTNTFQPDGTPMSASTDCGAPVTPQFHDSSQGRFGLVTLSAWIDPESAAAFSFHGAHGEAMNSRNEWFQQQHSWPSSVMWWTDDLELMTWEEANIRIGQLHESGPSTATFNFKSMYSATGERTTLDSQRVKELGVRS